MTDKDVKIKPKTVPKINNTLHKVTVKSKEVAVNTVKDAKSVIKDTVIKKASDKQIRAGNQAEQPQKVETESAEKVENMAYNVSGVAYHKSKAYTQDQLYKYNTNKIKTRESAENAPPDSSETPIKKGHVGADAPKSVKRTDIKRPKVKTREEYIKFQAEQRIGTEVNSVKTKENYIMGRHNKTLVGNIDEQSDTVKSKNRAYPKTQAETRKQYVAIKIKQKKIAEKAELESSLRDTVHNRQNLLNETDNISKTAEYSPHKEIDLNEIRMNVNSRNTMPSLDEKVSVSVQKKFEMPVKTKESFIDKLSIERVEPKSFRLNTPKQNTHTIVRNRAKHSVKMREIISGDIKCGVKSGNAYLKNSMKKKFVKVNPNAVKTQKEVARKATKETVKRAKELAQKTAQVAKAVAKTTTKIAVRIAQAAVQAAEKLVSALVAIGGWAVLVVVLIVVIIIASLAASPFGIFISEEVTQVGAIPLSQIIAECNVELTQEVENIELSIPHDDVEVVDNQANWNEIIAVFAAKTAGAEYGTAEDVVVFDAQKAEKLKQVFRASNTVRYATLPYTNTEGKTRTKLIITVEYKTKNELIVMYSLTAKQQEAVETLLEHGDIITSSIHSLAITDANVQAVLSGLPDSLPKKRKDVVKNAASLVGKVNYFWGGKSSAIGWDSAWGTMQRVTAPGSPSSGSVRAFGLDCSGFVTWAFNNSGMGYAVGHGTLGQKAVSTQVSRTTVQAGDLAFLPSYSHVGIVVGKDTGGNILVIHCSSSANNVVLATASSVGFTVFRRPNFY